MWIGGARVIVLNDKQEILMVRQVHERRDLWLPPGGGIEAGETSAEAAVRELREETGLEVELGELIWHIEEVSEARGMRFVNFFLGTAKDGGPVLGADPEFDETGQVLREVRFVSREEMLLLERVYPPGLKDEIWDILNKERTHQPYKVRVAISGETVLK